jgi:hypothetical protein
MSEWWTYSLSDLLLFSPRTYYRLFELYNAEIWPLQVAALLLGAVLLRGPPWRGRAIAAALASCWLWVAWAYLLARYDTINWAARYFAAGFAVEAGLLAWSGILRDRLGFPDRPDLAAWTGSHGGTAGALGAAGDPARLVRGRRSDTVDDAGAGCFRALRGGHARRDAGGLEVVAARAVAASTGGGRRRIRSALRILPELGP